MAARPDEATFEELIDELAERYAATVATLITAHRAVALCVPPASKIGNYFGYDDYVAADQIHLDGTVADPAWERMCEVRQLSWRARS